DAREDAVALGEAGRALAERLDRAGELATQGDGQRVAVNHLQLALADLVVDGVEAGCVHANQEFSRAGPWHRYLAKPGRVGAAVSLENERAHGHAGQCTLCPTGDDPRWARLPPLRMLPLDGLEVWVDGRSSSVLSDDRMYCHPEKH